MMRVQVEVIRALHPGNITTSTAPLSYTSDSDHHPLPLYFSLTYKLYYSPNFKDWRGFYSNPTSPGWLFQFISGHSLPPQSYKLHVFFLYPTVSAIYQSPTSRLHAIAKVCSTIIPSSSLSVPLFLLSLVVYEQVSTEYINPKAKALWNINISSLVSRRPASGFVELSSIYHCYTE